MPLLFYGPYYSNGRNLILAYSSVCEETIASHKLIYPLDGISSLMRSLMPFASPSNSRGGE